MKLSLSDPHDIGGCTSSPQTFGTPAVFPWEEGMCMQCVCAPGYFAMTFRTVPSLMRTMFRPGCRAVRRMPDGL